MTDRAIRDAEIATLVREREDMTLRTIGRMYGLTRQSVDRIARKAGVPPRGRWVRSPPLSQDERDEIGRLFSLGVCSAHIAREVGRSPAGVYGYLIQTGMHVPEDGPPPVTKREREMVRQVYGQPGVLVRDIAAKLGRTKNEIIGIANRMGLQNPRNSNSSPDRMKARARRNRLIRAAFKRGMSRHELAKHHGLSVVTIGHIVYRMGNYKT